MHSIFDRTRDPLGSVDEDMVRSRCTGAFFTTMCVIAVNRAATPRDGRAAELRTAVRESIKLDEPTLIEVPVPAMPNPWTVLELR